MGYPRRGFLKLFSLGGVATAAASAPSRADNSFPEYQVASIQGPSTDPIQRFLNRAGYGPRWGDRDYAESIGFEAYVEEQLDYENIEDPEADAVLRRLRRYRLPMRRLKRRIDAFVLRDFSLATYARALLSRRQLYEAMVELWHDHFNTDIGSGDPFMMQMKLVEDREVIRPHALGTFRALLQRSARSPAMLFYLDNVYNNVYGPDDTPNENYARELLELHTLGVDAGYTQEDVHEVARILTGWGAYGAGFRAGELHFDPDAHDYGQKEVLGQIFPEGRGAEEVDELLDMLVDHPSTARFIAGKLVRRFVADDPPSALVSRVADAFGADGDIKAMLRVIFLSDEFQAPETGPKLKRPYSYALSALRGLNVSVGKFGVGVLTSQLSSMGQQPFSWPAPDGYPDVAIAWASNLLPRWNFVTDLVLGRLSPIGVAWEDLWQQTGSSELAEQLDWVARQLTGQSLAIELLDSLVEFVDSGTDDQDKGIRKHEAVAAILCSAEFQWA